MSSRPETGRDSDAEAEVRPPRLAKPDRLGGGVGSVHLDLIACDGCGRRFATRDGREMIAAIAGPCPSCGGRFEVLA